DQDTSWGAWQAEHLLNRAGFGALPRQAERWAEKGQEALVDHLLGVKNPVLFDWEMIKIDRRALVDATPEERRKATGQVRSDDRDQLQEFVGWWLTRMVDGKDPLVERMSLFWHGHFTSSIRTVKRGGAMLQQNEIQRMHALGNFGSLLREMLRDPAMLVYLDNDENEKGKPNENLAREVMELFTLGEGNYSEQDVVEAARALTGYATSEGEFRFRMKMHDYGRKSILGIKGRHDAEDLAEILLAQPACADWVARRIVRYLEGLDPTPERAAKYGTILRDAEYEVRPLLRALFMDPDFYRAEVVGAKVLSPVDFVVGTARRLGIEVHPKVLGVATGILGQSLLQPPNVKGWEGGMSWLSTATLMQRGNLAGALLGVIDTDDVLTDEAAMEALDDMSMPPEMEMEEGEMMAMANIEEMAAELESTGTKSTSMGKLLVTLERRGYKPRMRLLKGLGDVAAGTDKEVVSALCDRLLAIDAPSETITMLVGILAQERAALSVDEGQLQDKARAGERILRRLAHLILSLPEAQLG
ncbi:MAG: hypothetical protein ACI8QC_003573, partial [Planctomycetota bacterium]